LGYSVIPAAAPVPWDLQDTHGSSEVGGSSHTLRWKCQGEGTQAGELALRSASCQYTWAATEQLVLQPAETAGHTELSKDESHGRANGRCPGETTPA